MKLQCNLFIKMEELSKTFIEFIRDFFKPNIQNIHFPKIFRQLNQIYYRWVGARRLSLPMFNHKY